MNKQTKQQERWYRAQAMVLCEPYGYIDDYFVTHCDTLQESDMVVMGMVSRWIDNGHHYRDRGRCKMELMEVVEVDHDQEFIAIRTIYE